MTERARHESVVRLRVRPPRTQSDPLAIATCWLVLVLGVLLVPGACLFWALITAGPVEYSGSQPPWSSESVAFVWGARVVATASMLGLLAITVVVTARGGRLINGWLTLALGLPVIVLLWDLQPG
jgi:hypothetical protein